MPDFSAQNDAPPVPPEKPGDEECCRSGCEPCIFDLYAQELERYRTALAAWEERQRQVKDTQGSHA
ncbi:oxidoreductase-like domain-containing protein [Herbaspirillum sp. ST 5-3]|uniref:oxidoreductase-like domain-containing protein n=1 Tax=Oxalobacteraceae TaxID=75682 RepID=UPI0010A3D616|nr:oxidoreductase-like domain-containing protein [Herbaspirillum sp. ST 5-3]